MMNPVKIGSLRILIVYSAMFLAIPVGAQTVRTLPPGVTVIEISDDASCWAKLQAELAPSAAPYPEFYRCKPDFAAVEAGHPLSDDLLRNTAVTPDYFKTLTQEHVDQIYARLKAGKLPEGDYRITLFRLPGGVPFEQFAALGGTKGKGLALLLTFPTLDDFGKVWGTKQFAKRPGARHQGIARTQLGDVTQLPKQIVGLMAKRKITATALPKDAGGRLLPRFPAKVYCGQSLLDSRRESIIIDYAFSHTLPDYLPIDSLMGPKLFQIRDEIRMVREGLYLGRVYFGKFFVFNMVLYNESLAATGSLPDRQECWPGTQQAALGPG